MTLLTRDRRVVLAGGVVAGWYSGRYGPAMRNGLLSGVLGVVLAAVAATLYGVGLSLSMGFGVDSLVSFYYSALGVLGFLLLVPLFAMEGVFGSIAANELRLRVGERT